MKIKGNRFVLALVVVIAVAYVFPYWGTKHSPIPIDVISAVGISLIFFFYGLKLSPEKLKSGLKNWQLHVLVQTTTFLVFPLLVLAFKPFLQTQAQETLWLAFFFLAALPSTVSSSVVMVSMAKGNVPAAIFNASISGVIGIVLTPLWLGLFVLKSQPDFDFSEIYIKLITQIIVPVVLGCVLQRFFYTFTQRYNKILTVFDKAVILLIVYKSFATSFYDNIFSTVSFLDLMGILIAVFVLFYAVYGFTGYFSKILHFNRADQITARFCGTKKSLVHGTVFSKIMFGNMAVIGIILLPIMLFHAIQLLIISIKASRLERETN